MTPYWKSPEQNKKFLRTRLRDILWFSSQHALKLTKSKKRRRFDFKNFLKVSTLLLCKKNNFARKLFQWWLLSFFHVWNYTIISLKTENVQKWWFLKNVIKNQTSYHLWINFRQLLTPKKVMVYYRANSRKIVWFGIFLLFCLKYNLWGIFPTQFLLNNSNFVSELENIGKYRFLKFTTLLTYQLAR